MKLAWPVLWVKLEFHHPQPAVPGARGQSPGRLRELCPGSVSAAGDEPGAVWPSEAPSGGQEISRGGGWSRLTHPCNGSLQGAAGASLAFTAGRGAVPLAGLAQEALCCLQRGVRGGRALSGGRPFLQQPGTLIPLSP